MFTNLKRNRRVTDSIASVNDEPAARIFSSQDAFIQGTMLFYATR